MIHQNYFLEFKQTEITIKLTVAWLFEVSCNVLQYTHKDSYFEGSCDP